MSKILRNTIRGAITFGLATAALVASSVFSTATAQESVGYTPDLVDVQFAEVLDDNAPAAHTVLPGVPGFWTDLVNTENVSETGEGVYVAVLDTGLVPQWPFFFPGDHIAADLGAGFSHDVYWDDTIGNIVIGPLKTDRGYITELASGHGTHVTSTIAGFNINNAFGVNGVAPGATIIPVLVLDAWEVPSPFGTLRFSGGTDAMIAAGIDYVTDLSDSLDGPVVINMSLGGPTRSAEIEAAIDRAIAAGVIVVVSAGNGGSAGMGYPGGLEQVISAGAAGWATMFDNGWAADVPERLKSRDANGNTFQIYLEDFSSRPNKDLDQKHQDLDVSAPGAWVVGPYKSAFANNLGYYYLSGTSMAAPHVAGIAALVLEANGPMSQSEMEQLLRVSAAGLPLPASDAVVTFPFIPDGYYPANWDGGDFGKGMVQADDVLRRVR